MSDTFVKYFLIIASAVVGLALVLYSVVNLLKHHKDIKAENKARNDGKKKTSLFFYIAWGLMILLGIFIILMPYTFRISPLYLFD